MHTKLGIIIQIELKINIININGTSYYYGIVQTFLVRMNICQCKNSLINQISTFNFNSKYIKNIKFLKINYLSTLFYIFTLFEVLGQKVRKGRE